MRGISPAVACAHDTSLGESFRVNLLCVTAAADRVRPDARPGRQHREIQRQSLDHQLQTNKCQSIYLQLFDYIFFFCRAGDKERSWPTRREDMRRITAQDDAAVTPAVAASGRKSEGS